MSTVDVDVNVDVDADVASGGQLCGAGLGCWVVKCEMQDFVG